MNEYTDTNWDIEISPKRHLFDINLKEIWYYRDLIYLFVHRDFVSEYKQTILGPAWHFFQPLFTTIIFTIVFSKIAKISTDGTSPFLFYMSGIVIWNYFANLITITSHTFSGNAAIFGKVYFPRLVIPVSNVFSKLLAFVIQFFFFLCFLVYFIWQGGDINPNLWILATPFLLFMMAALGLGLGIIVSSMTTRYRDLKILVGFGVQLLMYATPIIYPLSVLPEKWHLLISLNPVSPIVETFRHAYLGTGVIDYLMLGYSFLTISVILFIGVIMFNRVERTFMDTI